MSEPELILASASPRRLHLLRELGLDPRVWVPRIDESRRDAEPPRRLVARLARAKALDVARSLGSSGRAALVLAADTAVVLDGDVLGKPRDATEAFSMLARLRDRTHEVLTGVYLMRGDDGRAAGGVETTRVRFGNFDDRTIRDYVATGEPLDKAGAYAIQGGGERLARAVEGSWSNVVGLPLERLGAWLELLDLDLARLVARR